jgi:hypothetical protein
MKENRNAQRQVNTRYLLDRTTLPFESFLLVTCDREFLPLANLLSSTC